VGVVGCGVVFVMGVYGGVGLGGVFFYFVGVVVWGGGGRIRLVHFILVQIN